MLSELLLSIGKRCAPLILSLFFFCQSAWAEPPLSFTQSFVPSEIGPGSVATLQYSINNPNISPITGLSFINNLPAGVNLATPALVHNDCGGTYSAPDGGNTFELTDGEVGSGLECTITVGVTSSIVASHTNSSVTLNYDNGSVTLTDATLTVANDRPGFRKSFSPSSISLGSRSALSFTIDNTLNSNIATNILFSDTLPSGLVIADPANISDDCLIPGTVTALPGASLISYYNGAVAANSSCAFTVDVIGTANGIYNNTSSELTSSSFSILSSGKANASLEVTADSLHITKSFTDDPVAPGEVVTLNFTITNYDRNDSATNIAFTDDLGATLSGIVANNLPVINICGAGSQLTGTSMLTLTGGSLGPQESCSFSVELTIPAVSTPDNYPNTTSSITADIAGGAVTGNPAKDILFVKPVPLLTKTFIDDPIASGSPVILEFTITNSSLTSLATDITFTDSLDMSSTLIVSDLPANGFCGAGSSLTLFNSSESPNNLILNNGTLDSSESCTFSVTLTIPTNVPTGNIINTTSPITATIDGVDYEGKAASDTLTIVGSPTLTKEFIDDPAIPGETVILRFTMTNSSENTNATALSFSDDLNAVVPGLAAVDLPKSNVCGAGSQISGTNPISFTGGSLAAGGSCIFNVTLQVPADTATGTYSNTTSELSSTIGSNTVLGAPAQDDLMICSVSLIKSFTNDPVIPGETVNLQFTITNLSPTASLAGLSFSDDLSTTLPGLTAIDLPLSDICGAGSALSTSFINSFLTFTGGNLGPLGSCTFNVTLLVPSGIDSGTYQNTTSNLLQSGIPVSAPAADVLVVNNSLLHLDKTFLSNSVEPGGSVILEFSLTNLDISSPVDNITFTDNLGAVLAGMTAAGLPINDICGDGSQLSGTDMLTFTGGKLGPGQSCDFTVSLQIPVFALPGSIATNITSQVSGTISGLEVKGEAARDDLEIAYLVFTKSFSGTGETGRTVRLKFTIQNTNPVGTANGLSFSDDLTSVTPGLKALGLPKSNICGAGSVITGSSLLNFSKGNLGPNGTCTFGVDVSIPLKTSAGSYVNITSDLTNQGLTMAFPATATLMVDNDSDNDGLPNDWEVANGLNPLDPADASLDKDGDGFTNKEEYGYGTNPSVFDYDLNNNGLPDNYDSRIGNALSIFYLLTHD